MRSAKRMWMRSWPDSCNSTNPENGMSLIPRNFSRSIVAFGLEGSGNIIEYIATGFIYSQVTEQHESGHRLYANCFVTNRHVIDGPDELVVRLGDPQSSIYHLLGQWTVHPDPDVDVAVAPFPLDDIEGNAHKVISFKSDSQTSFCEDLQEMEFREGDEVYTLGFPLGLAGRDRNYPIARQGIVARIQDWYDGQSDDFLIDASIFPGNSGGPVLAKPTMYSYGQTRPHAKLIGVVSGYLTHADVALRDQTGRPILDSEENSGLATVVPIDKVRETIMAAIGK